MNALDQGVVRRGKSPSVGLQRASFFPSCLTFLVRRGKSPSVGLQLCKVVGWMHTYWRQKRKKPECGIATLDTGL